MVKTGAAVASVIETLEKKVKKKSSSNARNLSRNRSSVERSVGVSSSVTDSEFPSLPESEEAETVTIPPYPSSNRNRKQLSTSSPSSTSSSSTSLDLVSSVDEFPPPKKCPQPSSVKKSYQKTRSKKLSGTSQNAKTDSTPCDNDFHWLQHLTEDNSSASSKTLDSKDDSLGISNSTPIKLRHSRGTGSLERTSNVPRKERDKRCKSTSSYSQRHYKTNSEKVGTNCCHMGNEDFDSKLSDCCWHGSNPYLNYQPRPAQILSCHHHHCSNNAVPLCCQLDMIRSNRYAKPSEELGDQFKRLENDKDSLQLQVAVLSVQIEAQSEKISDLEKSLADQKERFESMKELLQKEMLAKSSLETQKLELLSVVTDLKRQMAFRDLENDELKEILREERKQRKPPIAPRLIPFPVTTSPVNMQTSNSSYRRPYDHYGSLPRQNKAGSESPNLRKGVMFGKPLHLYNSLSHDSQSEVVVGERSSSAPNLAETENIGISDTMSECGDQDFSPHQSPSLYLDKSKGIRKILGKLKRSNSGNLDDLSGGEFQRGGLRATANGRLTGSNPRPRPELPFRDWNIDSICDWLTEMGLENYVNGAKKWVTTANQLLNATSHDLEKHLGIKNPLHRKKLLLALQCERGGDETSDPLLVDAYKLETVWVLRWLDDVGLPQYKDSFLAARINGCTLHRLTSEDLSILHVSSVLHVASLRSGIQVLRNIKFDPNCLCRRSVPGESSDINPNQVTLWTNHRVMEWLRVVDLAEYAPNLRGSGVHGGLIMYEPRFTAELLASLLSIPPQKTLLRRHLSTHFKELLGRDVIQIKRDAEVSLGFVPLSATAKIKIPKKSQFTLKKKKSKTNLDFGDLVCPLHGKNASIMNIMESGDELTNSALSLSGKSGLNLESASEETNGFINQGNVSSSNTSATK